ncbi:2928_t:CDS:2, partial [Acaulospora colombiana]
GREDRELQRVLLAAIANAPNINNEIMRALRGLHDFIYLAQYNSHSKATLRYMGQALHAFHLNKQHFIDLGARRGKNGPLYHFNITKLYALLTYVGHIQEMGACPQYSTEITETCHQTMAKQAYRATNKRDYEKQMCRYLDRSDRTFLLKEVLRWWRKQEKRDILEEAIKDHSPDYQTLARALLLESVDEEMVSHSRSQERGHIWLNLKPHHSKRSLEDLASIYNIPHFLRDIATFLSSFNAPLWPSSDKIVDTWLNCRIQLPLVQDEDEQAAIRTVQALPPSPSLPYGRCSCVLVTEDKDAFPTGIDAPSAYEAFVERSLSPRKQPLGGVVELTSIARFIQLVPEFGSDASSSLSPNNSMDIFLGGPSSPNKQVMVFYAPWKDLFDGDLSDLEEDNTMLCGCDPALPAPFNEVEWQQPPFANPRAGAQLDGLPPFSPEPLRIKPLTYNQPYKDHQHTNNLTELHTSRRHRRGGARQKARNEAQNSGAMDSNSSNSLFQGTLWRNRVEHLLPKGVDPLAYFKKRGNAGLAKSIAESKLLPPMLHVPPEGYWVLPIRDVPGSSWMRGSMGDKPLEGWGPQYFAIRTPSGTVSENVIKRIFVQVKFLLDGDQVSHKPIKPYMKNDQARSEFDARHVGIIGHYGKDDVGPRGLRLSKDTFKQGAVEMDALSMRQRTLALLEQETWDHAADFG